jgi:hypothetical protein
VEEKSGLQTEGDDKREEDKDSGWSELVRVKGRWRVQGQEASDMEAVEADVCKSRLLRPTSRDCLFGTSRTQRSDDARTLRFIL